MPEADEDQLAQLLDAMKRVSDFATATGLPKPQSKKIRLHEIEFDKIEGENWIECLGAVHEAIPNFSMSGPNNSIELAQQIFLQINPSGDVLNEGNYVDNDGEICLTSDGATLLYDTMECAIKSIATCVEGAGNTESWRRDFGELQDEDDDAPHELNANITDFQIQAFSSNPAGYELNPEFQRDFVWTDKAQQKLITSILLGIPVPSVIINRTSKDGFNINEVVDGKQRITSIFRFMGVHPRAVAFAKEKGWFDKEDSELPNSFSEMEPAFDIQARQDGVTGQERKDNFLPFKTEVISDKPELSKKYYWHIEDETIRSFNNLEEKVKSVYTSPTSQYSIPIIQFTEAHRSDIHYVFERYNREGLTLKPEELRNSAFHDLSLLQFAMDFGGYFARSKDRLIEKFGIDEGNFEVEDGRPRTGFRTLNIPAARYALQKSALWAISIICHPPIQKQGVYSTPSTKVHIDRMLKETANSIEEKMGSGESEEGNEHPLDLEGMKKIAVSMSRCLGLIVGCRDDFPSCFRKIRGGERSQEWFELCAMMSLSSLMILDAYYEGDIEKLEASLERILVSEGLVKPNVNTQSTTQWFFLGKNITQCVTSGVGEDGEVEEAFVAFKNSMNLQSNPQDWLNQFAQNCDDYTASPFEPIDG